MRNPGKYNPILPQKDTKSYPGRILIFPQQETYLFHTKTIKNKYGILRKNTRKYLHNPKKITIFTE